MEKFYKDYVCYNCFRTLDKCECTHRPYNLIMIDGGIQDHVRTLREKGYITTGCCESHDEICVSIYISFAIDYGFGENISLPDGFRFDKNKRMIVYNFNRNLSKEEIKAEKEKKLNELLEWCNDLPYIN